MAWVAGEAPRERRGEVIGGVLGAAIFGVQLGPVVGAVADRDRARGRLLDHGAFGVALGAWALTMPAPRGSEVLTAPAAALRQRSMLAGMWLTALPAAAFGVLDVLAPLRLAALGPSGLALGATFFAAAGVEASSRPGRGGPLIAAARCPSRASGWPSARVALVVLQLPDSAWSGWPSSSSSPPACSACCGCRRGLLLTAGAELIDLDDAYAYAFFNLGVGGRLHGRRGGRRRPGPGDDRCRAVSAARGAYAVSLAVADRILATLSRVAPVPIADLELDLEVFSGPFDLLLTLVLREEVDLLEVELADVVLATSTSSSAAASSTSRRQPSSSSSSRPCWS